MNTTLWVATQEQQQGRPWPLIIALALGGVVWLYKLWRSVRDRVLATTLATATLPVGLIWVSAILSWTRDTPPWLFDVIIWGPTTLTAALLCAAGVLSWQDRRTEAQLRARTGMATRRRILRPWQLALAWLVVTIAVILVITIAGGIVIALTGTAPVAASTWASRLGAALGCGFLVSLAIGFYRVRRIQPRKIRQEDLRLRDLDLRRQDGDEDSAGATTP